MWIGLCFRNPEVADSNPGNSPILGTPLKGTLLQISPGHPGVKGVHWYRQRNLIWSPKGFMDNEIFLFLYLVMLSAE